MTNRTRSTHPVYPVEDAGFRAMEMIAVAARPKSSEG